jgi:VWFA-related protein
VNRFPARTRWRSIIIFIFIEMNLLPKFQLAALVGTACLFAQQEPTIRVDVQQVLVPTFVTDKKGHHVSGLRAADFELLEDGVAQEIASVSSDVGAWGPRHTFVICLDLLHTSASDAARMRQALESLFEKEKASDAQYVLLGIGLQLQVLQAATSNPLEILLKVRGPAFHQPLGGLDETALSAELQSVNSRMEEFCRRCSCSARSNQRSCDSEIDTLKQGLDGDAERWIAPSRGMVKQFQAAVEELAKLPTARTLILISGGFDMDPKREIYAAAAAYLPNAPQLHIEGNPEMEPALEEALKTAAARNVTIYAIDPRRGVATAPAKAGAMDASATGATSGGGSILGTNRNARGNDSMRSGTLQGVASPRGGGFAAPDSGSMERLARSTGGVYTHEAGDLVKPLHSAVADGHEYYVLSYTPKNSAHDGKFRTIKVEAKDPKLSIRAKAGYWAQ